MKSRPYDNWFGNGDVAEDVAEAIRKNGKPLRIFVETGKYMATLIYADKVVITGYDDNEYQHYYVCDEEVQP